MEPYETKVETEVQSPSEPEEMADAPAAEPAYPAEPRAESAPATRVAPGTESGEHAAPSYVYSIGRIEPRFPNLSVEREFAQVRALEKRLTAGKTEQETLYLMLSKYRYLSRQMCYVLTVQGVETYILQPDDPADFGLLLVEALRPSLDTADVRFDVVIGVRGPIAQPDRCGGLMIPVVSFDQIYSFTKAALLESIPIPNAYGEMARKADPLAFRRSAGGGVERIIQMG